MRQKSGGVHSGCLCVLILLLTALSAAANPGRAVYANGQVHRATSDTYVTMQQGAPADAVNGSGTFKVAKTIQSTYGVCRGFTYPPGEGLAVFNNKIYYTFTANTDCLQSSRGMSAYVATFDLTSSLWTSLKTLGSVHVNNLGQAGAGAAITVFNSQLYAFTDNGTYTSGDGVSWTVHPALWDLNHEPLDALTIYPADADPKILIAYGYENTKGNYFSSISAATWNGQFGTASDFSKADIFNAQLVYGKVALLPGTKAAGSGFAAGGKLPTVQLFMNTATSNGPGSIRNMEYTYGSSGGTWTTNAFEYADGDLSAVWVYPWYVQACDSTTPAHQARKQVFIVNYTSGSAKSFAFNSDNMVPKNHTIPMSSCGDSGGSGTDTASGTDEEMAIRRNYWSLVGVILGSPPFAVNGLTNPLEIGPVSNVEYGQTSGTQVMHSQQWSNENFFSAGVEVRAGLFDELLKVKGSFDIGYKHAYEATHESTWTSETGFAIGLGTENSSNTPEELGRLGWAIFSVPTVIVQDYAIYAYDYSPSTGAGTSLNQDLHVVEASPNALTVTEAAFELANPGGPRDTFPGLLTGMKAYPPSTDLSATGWTGQTWERTDAPWTVVLGNGELYETRVNTLTFARGAGGTTQFSSTQETMDASGQTTSVELAEAADIGIATKLAGIKLGLEAGQAASFFTDVSNKTEFGAEMKASLKMKNCETEETGCVTYLMVQPFWLQATDSTAPWIPTAYKDQRPWCMTWNVTQVTSVTGAGSSATAGTALAPLGASGRIVNGTGGLGKGDPSSRYSVEGGHLAWADAGGIETRIPMTADEFVPSLGVSLDLNGLAWSSSGTNGFWTRRGEVWTFESGGNVQRNRVILDLDFGAAAFDLQMQKADLEGRLAAGVENLLLRLVVNGRYTFSTALQHDIDIAWRWSQAAAKPETVELTSFEGSYNSANGSGNASIAGTLPSDLSAFGDVGLEMNGREITIPLMTMDGFEEAVQSGGVLRYVKNGLVATVDFDKKSWSVALGAKSFHELFAPRWGAVRVQFKVGGLAWHRLEIPVEDFTATLTLRK